jgi:4-amino-4-deoxy-L-arabinose transferase-like glycosyltransferase
MPRYVKYLIVIVGAGLLFLPFLGQVHLFDWDEINFAECAREMIASKDYLRPQIDFMPFWEKPPFFIWMQVVAMKLFGVGEYAARFPNAFMGVLTLVSLFYVGKRVVSERVATWWVILYAATWLPHFYFKSGIIDPTFNFFIFLAFFQVHLIRYASRKMLHSVLAGIFLGLAVLTKGPVAILIALIALVVYAIINRGLTGYKTKYLLIVAVFAALPMLSWLGINVAVYGTNYGSWFVHEFITYQVRLFSTEDADHGGPFFYHFVTLLIGCFPSSIFLLLSRRRQFDRDTPAADFTRWMWLLFWVVLILFSVVKTKIVHYSSLCYFPLTYLAALQVVKLLKGEAEMPKWAKGILIFIGGLIALLVGALPLVGIFKGKIVPYIDDPFAVGNLSAHVSWSYAECMWGVSYIIAIVVAVMLMKRNFSRGVAVLSITQVIMIQAVILHFTPKIEAYSQRAAIEYFKGFAGRDVYVHPLGYKSYANLFYTQKGPFASPEYKSVRNDEHGNSLQPEPNEKWLLTGAVDKPVYFICKIQDAQQYRQMPNLQEIGGSNGFAFFKRK